MIKKSDRNRYVFAAFETGSGQLVKEHRRDTEFPPKQLARERGFGS